MIEVIQCVYAGDSLEGLRRSIVTTGRNQSMPPDYYSIYVDGYVDHSIRSYLNQLPTSAARDGIVYQISYGECSKGLAYGLNRLIEKSEAQLLIRMDSDDESHQKRIETLYEFFKKNPNVAVCGSWLREVSEVSDKIKKYPLSHAGILKSITRRSPMAHASCAFNLSCLRDDLKYDESFLNSQDLELWIRLLTIGYKFENLPKPLYTFYYDSNLKSRRGVQKLKNELKLYHRANSIFGWSFISLFYLLLRIIMRVFPSLGTYIFNRVQPR